MRFCCDKASRSPRSNRSCRTVGPPTSLSRHLMVAAFISKLHLLREWAMSRRVQTDGCAKHSKQLTMSSRPTSSCNCTLAEPRTNRSPLLDCAAQCSASSTISIRRGGLERRGRTATCTGLGAYRAWRTIHNPASAQEYTTARWSRDRCKDASGRDYFTRERDQVGCGGQGRALRRYRPAASDCGKRSRGVRARRRRHRRIVWHNRRDCFGGWCRTRGEEPRRRMARSWRAGPHSR